MQVLLCRALALGEYVIVCGLGIGFGLPAVIRYLRNPNPRITIKVLRKFGAKVGNGTTIKGSLFVDNVNGDANSTGDLSHLTIGNNCYIGDAVFFDLADNILIRNNAVIAGRASFITHAECNRSPYLSEKFPRTNAPVIVGEGAWVGYGATVLQANIGAEAAIGAHSLLLRDAASRHVYAGTPARQLRPIA